MDVPMIRNVLASLVAALMFTNMAFGGEPSKPGRMAYIFKVGFTTLRAMCGLIF